MTEKIEKMQFCQSCGMPLHTAGDHGTNTDGSRSEDYCQYCYTGGAFTGSETMEEMIESCVPHCIGGNPWNSEEEARAAMREIFPTLKRWKQ